MAQIVESNNYGHVRTPMRFWRKEDWLMRKRKYCKQDCKYNLITCAHYIPDFEIVRPTQYTPYIDTYIDGLDADYNVLVTEHLPSINPEIFTLGDKDYLCWDSRKMYIDRFLYGDQQMPSSNAPEVTCLRYSLIQVRVRTSQDGYNYDEWVSEPMQPLIERMESDYFYNAFGTGLLAFTATGGWSWSGTNWCNNGSGGTLTFTFPDSDWKKRYARIRITTSGAASTGFGLVANTDAIGVVVFPAFTEWFADIVFNANGTLTILADGDWNGCIQTMTVQFYTDDICDHLKLTWANACDLFNMFNTPCGRLDGHGIETICYQADGVRRRWDGMLNEFFMPMDAELGFPDIKSVTEVVQNGNRNQEQVFKERQRRFNAELGLIPEHILEALSDIPFFETIILSLKNGAGDEELTYFTLSYSWEFQKCYTACTVNFGFGDDIVDTACCELLPLLKCCEELACQEVDGFFEDFDEYSSDSLSPELVTNGGFTGSAAGWTLSLATYNVNNVDLGDGGYAKQTIASLVAGRKYRVQFTIQLGLTTTPSLGGTLGTPVTGTLLQVLHTQDIICGLTGGDLRFDYSGAMADSLIDNVSVKELSNILVDGHYYIRRSDGAIVQWDSGDDTLTEVDCISEVVTVNPDWCCKTCQFLNKPTDELIGNSKFTGDAALWTLTGSAAWHLLSMPDEGDLQFSAAKGATAEYSEYTFVRCHSYRLKFDILNYYSGILDIQVNGISRGTFNANGSYVLDFIYFPNNVAISETLILVTEAGTVLEFDNVHLFDLGCLSTTSCCRYLNHDSAEPEWISMAGEIFYSYDGLLQAYIPEGYNAIIFISQDAGLSWNPENLYCSLATFLRYWTHDQLLDGVPYCHPSGDFLIKLFTFNNNCEAGYSDAVHVQTCEDAACYEVHGDLDRVYIDDRIEGHYYYLSDGTVVLWSSGEATPVPCDNGIVFIDTVDCACQNCNDAGAPLVNMITNGTFNLDISGFTQTEATDTHNNISWNLGGGDGYLQMKSDGAGSPKHVGFSIDGIELIRCHWYTLKYDIRSYVKGKLFWSHMPDGSILTGGETANGSYSHTFVSPDAGALVAFADSGADLGVDNIILYDLGCGDEGHPNSGCFRVRQCLQFIDGSWQIISGPGS
jgi:hypothetical protein